MLITHNNITLVNLDTIFSETRTISKIGLQEILAKSQNHTIVNVVTVQYNT